MKTSVARWTAVGVMVAIFATIASLAIIRAVTFLVLWGWFIAPLGVSDLNIWWSLGLMTAVGMFFYQKNDPDSAEFRAAQGLQAKLRVMAGHFDHLVIYCALCLVLGAFYHWMM
jgi:hypothetical protein